jgi:hypothetical protein
MSGPRVGKKSAFSSVWMLLRDFASTSGNSRLVFKDHVEAVTRRVRLLPFMRRKFRASDPQQRQQTIDGFELGILATIKCSFGEALF